MKTANVSQLEFDGVANGTDTNSAGLGEAIPTVAAAKCDAHAERSLEAGVPLPVIQRLLGHSNLATTSRYLHVRREVIGELKGLLEALDHNPLIKPSA